MVNPWRSYRLSPHEAMKPQPGVNYNSSSAARRGSCLARILSLRLSNNRCPIIRPDITVHLEIYINLGTLAHKRNEACDIHVLNRVRRTRQ